MPDIKTILIWISLICMIAFLLYAIWNPSFWVPALITALVFGVFAAGIEGSRRSSK